MMLYIIARMYKAKLKSCIKQLQPESFYGRVHTI